MANFVRIETVGGEAVLVNPDHVSAFLRVREGTSDTEWQLLLDGYLPDDDKFLLLVISDTEKRRLFGPDGFFLAS